MSVPFAEVVGDPVAHSKSPVMHRAWLAALGIEGDYRAAHVRSQELAAHFETCRTLPDWRGANVTVPHKVACLDLVDECSADVTAIGAANCIVPIGNGRLRAENTDWTGFFAALGKVDLRGAHAIIIGAGGAARAVLYALASNGIGNVTILNRTHARAHVLLKDMQVEGDVLALDAALPPADLLVNASSLGMVSAAPLSVDLAPLPAHATVCDIVYAPLETPLLTAARGRGLRTVDGLGMLIEQARTAFELFFGQTPPADSAALRRLLTS
ncbi:MAG: shikimate dehydrogenase [Pseudomonadota bacterium]